MKKTISALIAILTATALFATPAFAQLAAPPLQDEYLVVPGVNQNGLIVEPSQSVSGSVQMWWDQTFTAWSAQGGPRVASTNFPIPVSCTGCSGTGPSTATQGNAGSLAQAWYEQLVMGGALVSPTNKLPVATVLDALVGNGSLQVSADAGPVTGNITTQNLVSAGTATAASAVVFPIDGQGTVIVGVTGTYTGALSIQVSADGVTWVTVSNVAAVRNIATGAEAATIASASVGIFEVNSSGLNAVRVTALAAVTGTANITMRGGSNQHTVSMDGPLIAGISTLGYVYVTPQSTNGLTEASYVNAASSAMGSLVSTGAHALYGYSVCNNGTAAVYFRTFNLATAPVVGTTVPLMRILVAAGTCANLNLESGDIYALGLGFDVTTGSLADNDTATIATASTVSVNIHYK